MIIQIIPDLFRRYVKGTEKQAIVQFIEAFLCNMSGPVSDIIAYPHRKVFISTRVIKHLYDKRTAQEFDFLINNCHLIVKYPDSIYKNKDFKKGRFAFVKEIRHKKYLCSLEIIEKENVVQCEIVTCFPTDDAYLENFELLWEWKDGEPSS